MTDPRLIRDGEIWTLSLGEASVQLRDRKGLRYLATLLAHPGVEFHALDLAATAAEGGPPKAGAPRGAAAAALELSRGLGDAGEVLDATAKQQYKARLEELREELDEAEAFNDPERVAHAQREMDVLNRELAAAVGLGGRDRRSASSAERARVSVTKAIKSAIGKVTEAEPSLGRYLELAVKTGLFSSYDPQALEAVRPGVATPADAQPPPDEGRTPFVGRTAELSTIEALVERAAAGRGGLVLIGGDAGVGKTRLCSQVAAGARQRGFLVLTGHCYERGRDLPYMPWVEIAEAAVEALPREQLRAAMGEAASELTRLIPRLRAEFPDIPEPVDLPTAEQRRHTLGQFRDFIAKQARATPRLYVLEDLQWADDSTLLCLEHLAERLAEIPAVVLGTYRDAPSEMSPELAETIAGFVRSKRSVQISLSPHSESEVTALLGSLSGHDPPEDVAAAIYADTHGNAFFVEELYRHLQEAGELDEAGAFRAPDGRRHTVLPANVRVVVNQRLGRLSTETYETLRTGAVIGPHFNFKLLRAVSDLDEGTLFDAVEEAERSRLLTTTSTEPDERLGFSHELVRQTLLADLSSARLRRVHERVAKALMREHAADPQLHASEIAAHLLQAGQDADPDEVAQYLVLAGDQAYSAAAFEEAVRHYEAALDVSSLSPERRADVLQRAGFALRSVSRWPEAMAAWEEAVELLRELGDLERVADLCWELAAELGTEYRHEDMLAVVGRGIEAIGDDKLPQRAALLALLATAAGIAGNYDRAHAALGEARRIADPTSDDRLLVQVEFAEMDCHYYFMELPQTATAARRALEPLRAVDDAWWLTDALSMLAAAETYQGHFARAEAALEEIHSLSGRVGASQFLRVAGWSRFAAAARRGDIAAAEAIAEELVPADTLDLRPPAASDFTRRGIARFWRGAWEEALADFEQGAELAPSGFWFGAHHGFLFLMLATTGAEERARTLLDEIRDSLPRVGARATLGQWNLAILVAEGMGILADREGADAAYPLVCGALRTGAIMRQVDGRLIHGPAGAAAAAAGMDARAREHFDTALRQARELPHKVDEPHILHAYARFLAQEGDIERAEELARAAADAYDALGMKRHRELVEGDPALTSPSGRSSSSR